MLRATCGAKYHSRRLEMLYEGLMGRSPGLLLYHPLQRHTRFQQAGRLALVRFAIWQQASTMHARHKNTGQGLVAEWLKT